MVSFQGPGYHSRALTWCHLPLYIPCYGSRDITYRYTAIHPVLRTSEATSFAAVSGSAAGAVSTYLMPLGITALEIRENAGS